MQQIMGACFPKDKGGECVTLSHWEKSMCQKKKPKNICPFPHAFMFSSSLMFWGAGDVLIIHPSFTNVFFFFLPHAAEPS